MDDTSLIEVLELSASKNAEQLRGETASIMRQAAARLRALTQPAPAPDLAGLVRKWLAVATDVSGPVSAERFAYGVCADELAAALARQAPPPQADDLATCRYCGERTANPCRNTRDMDPIDGGNNNPKCHEALIAAGGGERGFTAPQADAGIEPSEEEILSAIGTFDNEVKHGCDEREVMRRVLKSFCDNRTDRAQADAGEIEPSEEAAKDLRASIVADCGWSLSTQRLKGYLSVAYRIDRARIAAGAQAELDALRARVREAVEKLRKQTECLVHYSLMETPRKVAAMPTVVEIQASHFNDLADELAALLEHKEA